MMSICSTAARAAMMPAEELLWRPLVMVLQWVHARLAADGARLRWWRADERDVAADRALVKGLFEH